MPAFPLVQEVVGVDTNVLLRAYVPGADPQKETARRFILRLSPQKPGLVTQLTLTEFYFVLRRTYKLPRLECLDLIARLLKTPVFEFEDGESVEYALDRAYEGADFQDALIDQTHRLLGAHKTVTFDQKAADRLGWELLE